MDDQEHTSNGSNKNGRHSKKPKPKKVPQRGLGVAQLEKIRLEEAVKNDAANLPSSAVTPHPPAIPFPWNPRPYPFANDNFFGHIPYNPHLNPRHHNIGTADSTTLNDNLLSSKYTQEVEKSTSFSQNPNPPYEPMCMSHFGVMLHGNLQSSSFSSSLVNDAAENSSSAVLSSQTEPPSNQSPYGTYRSIQPDESEKTIGTKRPCPFSLQDPSYRLLHSRFNPFTLHSLEKSTPHSNSGSLVIKGNPSFSDSTPHSISTSDLHYTEDNRAPPVTMSLFPSSTSKQALSYRHARQAELLKHDSTSHQVDTLDSDSQAQQQSFYMFFPESKSNITRDGQSTVMTSHYRHETDEDCIDLNLKI